MNTDVSEDALTTRTEVTDVTEFAEMRRTERSQSFSVSRSAEARIKIVDVSGSVSASYDAEQTNLFQSSGASEENSKVFVSQGVKRVARVEMEDFEGSRSFVTFSPAFSNRLREYMKGGFQKEVAYSILDHYGQFVLTRGIFGGFMEVRMTMTGGDYRDSFDNEEDASSCFDIAVSGEVGVLGLGSASAENEAGFCSDTQLKSMRASRSSFRDETNEAAFRGAKSSCTNPNDVSTCSFEVDAESSELLITNDKYPQGDPGVHFQLLSDFLNPEKISPLEVRRLQITEAEFGEIRKNFEKHTLEFLGEVDESLGGCNCADGHLAYLVADRSDSSRFGCECYDPSPTATRNPSPSPTPMPTPFGCDGVPHQNSPNDETTPDFAGSMTGSTWCTTFFGTCHPGATFRNFNTFQGTTSKWFRGQAKDQTCDADVKHQVTLVVPKGVDYDLTVYKDTPSKFYDSSTNKESELLPGTGITAPFHIENIEITDDNRGYDYWVHVEYISGSSCEPWTLSFNNYHCSN